MTTEHLAPGARSPGLEEAGLAGPSLPVTTILAMCDRLLGEVGRRRHMFAWLRGPGAAADEWLPVDAYYPRARLVVICRSAPDSNDRLYRERIPARGLGLLTLDPGLLGDDPAVVEAGLAAKIFDLEHVPRPAPPPPHRSAPAPSWTPVKVERAAVAPAMEQGLGLLVGLALAVILIVEVYLGVVGVAFTAGRVMLGFAIALEACSRAIGTVAAARSGERSWAGTCAIGGAPFVIWYAFWRPSGRSETEPAPLAGLLAGVAVVVGVLALALGH
ncbi:MAG: hypothetical protein JO027_08890 [Solirubrobacterales bacterium]|nr:hypothetical protein [Solirubrobacterales bacterium]